MDNFENNKRVGIKILSSFTSTLRFTTSALYQFTTQAQSTDRATKHNTLHHNHAPGCKNTTIILIILKRTHNEPRDSSPRHYFHSPVWLLLSNFKSCSSSSFSTFHNTPCSLALSLSLLLPLLPPLSLHLRLGLPPTPHHTAP